MDEMGGLYDDEYFNVISDFASRTAQGDVGKVSRMDVSYDGGLRRLH